MTTSFTPPAAPTTRASRDSPCLRVALLALVAWGVFPTAVRAEGPSFDCAKAEKGSIEDLVCNDEELAKLDRSLAEVYAAAVAKADRVSLPELKAEQRGWISGRDECWKVDDRSRCVGDEYRLRVVELQARYRLVAPSRTVTYGCDGDPRNEVVATFFPTDPRTLVAERGDQVSFMVLEPAASGAKYKGRNESLWEHHGEATIVWGFEAPAMTCKAKTGGETPQP